MVDSKEKATQKLGKRLGKNIAERRKILQLTQSIIAERLGVDTETVSRFERGVSLPSLVTLQKLAEVLRTTVSGLLEEMPPPPDTQAIMITTWLAGLKDKDRAFVISLMKSTCNYLSDRR